MGESENTTEYIVDGYRFSNMREYSNALKENQKIEGLKQKISNYSIEDLVRIYNKLTSKNYFKTAVGYGFLHEMRSYIVEQTGDDSIAAIPVVATQTKSGGMPEELTNGKIDRLENRIKSQTKKIRYMGFGDSYSCNYCYWNVLDNNNP